MTAEIYDLARYQSKKAVKADPKSIEETLAGIFEAALSEGDFGSKEYVAPPQDSA